jgi:cell division protein FtsL
MNQQVSQKTEEISRLKMALSDLNGYSSEFDSSKKLCLMPELTAKTWFGSLASKFQSFQSGDLLRGYLALSQTQLNNVITNIEAKISTLESSVTQLEQNISSHNTRINQLTEQRQQELNKK